MHGLAGLLSGFGVWGGGWTAERMSRFRLSGDDAVLAFPTLAGVQVSAAAGPPHPAAVVLVDELLVAEVAQLHGFGDGLTQEVAFVLRFGGRGAGGAPAVVLVLVPGVLAQAAPPPRPGVLKSQIGRRPGTLPEGLGWVSPPSSRSEPVPGAPWGWETVVIFTHAQQRPLLRPRSPIGHQIEGVLGARPTGPSEMVVVVPAPLGDVFRGAEMNIRRSSASADMALTDGGEAGGVDVTHQTQPVLFLEDEARR